MTTPVRLVGRSSSHFTRVAAIFAHELAVPYELEVVPDLMSSNPSAYAGNPALKIPSLRAGDDVLFGTENVCRALAARSEAQRRVVWPEDVGDLVARNAHELAWHGMAAQVQLVAGTQLGKLPPEHPYFAKARAGLEGALRWIDEHLPRVLAALPAPRDVSLFEVALFCLVEHASFRSTVPTEPYGALARFAADFSERPSAQRTVYRYHTPPRP